MPSVNLVSDPESIGAFTGPENVEPVNVATIESLIETVSAATFIPVPAPTFMTGVPEPSEVPVSPAPAWIANRSESVLIVMAPDEPVVMFILAPAII